MLSLLKRQSQRGEMKVNDQSGQESVGKRKVKDESGKPSYTAIALLMVTVAMGLAFWTYGYLAGAVEMVVVKVGGDKTQTQDGQIIFER